MSHAISHAYLAARLLNRATLARILANMTGIRTRNETLLVGVLLTAVGGFLDAYTFVSHAVFANAQTGNVVLFGIETASRHWHEALLRLIPITAFVVGVVAAEMVGRSRVRGRLHRPLRVVLGAEIVILAAVASLPDNALALVVTVPVSFAAAIQWTIFPSTLLASGNLRGVGVSAYLWIADRDPTARRQTLRFGAVVGAFVVGAMIGGVCTNNFGTSAAAVAAGMLLVILGVVIRETRQLERRAAGATVEAGGASPAE